MNQIQSSHEKKQRQTVETLDQKFPHDALNSTQISGQGFFFGTLEQSGQCFHMMFRPFETKSCSPSQAPQQLALWSTQRWQVIENTWCGLSGIFSHQYQILGDQHNPVSWATLSGLCLVYSIQSFFFKKFVSSIQCLRNNKYYTSFLSFSFLFQLSFRLEYIYYL